MLTHSQPEISTDGSVNTVHQNVLYHRAISGIYSYLKFPIYTTEN